MDNSDKDRTPSAPTDAGAADGTTRRVMLRSAGLAGGIVAVTALAGCGSSGGDDDAGSSDDAAGAGTTESVAKSKVPVGSGIIEDSLQTVVTQPTKGEFKAFDYLCTHQQCPVSEIKGDTIKCTCHGSEFSIKDGSVTHGPATKPLTAKKATVQGSKVVIS